MEHAMNPAGFGIGTLLMGQAKLLHGQTPLQAPIVAEGDPRRFSAFSALPQLESGTAILNAWDGAARTARAWSPRNGPKYELFATREQIGTLYNAGCTIVLESIERFVPALRPLCRALERDLGIHPGSVNVEVFCSRSQGVSRPHFDPSFTFNCQLSGEKTWRLGSNDAIAFPTAGMFLDAPMPMELWPLATATLPKTLVAQRTVVAKPGTVVFLPPGVLHETESSGETYAVAFAIERTRTVARSVADIVYGQLARHPMLRAARLGAQHLDVRAEASLSASVLREMADDLEAGRRGCVPCTFVLRRGLVIKREEANSIVLAGPKVTRTVHLDPVPIEILVWAGDCEPFSLMDLSLGLPMIDPQVLEACLEQLHRAGLLEHAQ
jgi:hypothetical protein